jgi:hypothetical protein
MWYSVPVVGGFQATIRDGDGGGYSCMESSIMLRSAGEEINGCSVLAKGFITDFFVI